MKDKDGTPSSNEFGQLRSYLAQNGMSQAQINDAVGTAPAGRTRLEITNELREWLRTI